MFKTQIIGNLTKDPVTRTTNEGNQVVGFTVAVRVRKDKATGDDITVFFNCSAWNKTGDNIAKYCKKGSKVYVEGAMESEIYHKKDGTVGLSYIIKSIAMIEFLSSPPNSTGRGEIDLDTAIQAVIDEDKITNHYPK